MLWIIVFWIDIPPFSWARNIELIEYIQVNKLRKNKLHLRFFKICSFYLCIYWIVFNLIRKMTSQIIAILLNFLLLMFFLLNLQFVHKLYAVFEFLVCYYEKMFMIGWFLTVTVWTGWKSGSYNTDYNRRWSSKWSSRFEFCHRGYFEFGRTNYFNSRGRPW